MNKGRTISSALIAAFIILQVITLAGLIKSMNYAYINDVFYTSAFILFFAYIEKRYDVYIKDYVRGATLLLIVSHTLLGNWLDLYTKSNLFDRMQHILGTYALTLFIYSFINGLFGTANTRRREFIDILALGVALGAVLEILEFIADMASKPKTPYQPSIMDTDLDLISDVFGALIAAFFSSRTKMHK